MTKIPIGQMSCRAACGALLTTALALATPAAADDGAEEMPWKRLGLDVGSMVMTFDSELSLDTNSGDLGTSINLEEVLGLDENLASFRARGYWRFLPRHTIDLQYYQLKREGNVAATGGFELGDIQVGVGAALDSELRLDTWKASYAYSFIQTPKWDVNAGLGLHAMDIKLRVTASGAVVIQDPDGVVIEEGGGVSETASALAPLPVIGLGASYAITPKLFLRAKGELFALRFGDYKGALFDGILAMDYDLTKNFGVGAAFNLVNIGVEATADEFVGSLDYRYDSLLIYARLFM